MNERLVFVILALVMYLIGLLNSGIHITVETTSDRPESGYSSYYTPDADTHTQSYDYECAPALEEEK